MDRYVVNNNEQDNGDHEVHNLDNPCHNMPKKDYTELGWHHNCHEAVKEATRVTSHARINGCEDCCIDCHTT